MSDILSSNPGRPLLPAANELGRECSPYLLQHARQPVHWLPWGERAFAAARAANRPVMLSVGYAACHWCHVMAHESFDDPETAELLNRSFISIKVDREERPDIDQIYMNALQATGQQGGWPLTMFLTSEAEPFWGGTYFPPHPRWGRPGFRDVLRTVATAYENGDAAVPRNAQLLASALRASASAAPGAFPDPDQLAEAAAAILSLTDTRQGGFRGAPKFPNFPAYRFLAQRGARGDAAAAGAVYKVLNAICSGGVTDHVGGGMFRYATDDRWLVPHFEKMLYDNAQFLELLALAYPGSGSEIYRGAAHATAGFLLRELTSGGAFASSLDADSAEGEGAYYVWTESEIDTLLGERSPAFKAAFGVTTEGNWEGRSILHRPAEAAGGDRADFDADLATLASARKARPAPALDDKVLADWNGLAIAALCRASHAFAAPAWLEAASERFEALRSHLYRNGRWQHAWRGGVVSARGLIDDLAGVGLAALALYEGTGRTSYLTIASDIVTEADTYFGPAESGYAMTASDATDLPDRLRLRPRSAVCSAMPSGSGLMAWNLGRLFHLTGEDRYRDRARAVIEAFAGRYGQPLGNVTLLAAAELLEDGLTVVVAGAPDLPQTRALLGVALAAPDPAVCVLRLPPGSTLPPSHPAYGKAAPDGTAQAFLCRGGVCQAPTGDPASLRQALYTAAFA